MTESVLPDTHRAMVESALPRVLVEVMQPRLTFDDIYDRHFDFVWRSLRHLGVAQSALDDLAQEVFLVVHRRLAEFEHRSTLKTWLFGIALGTARNHRRGMRRKGPPEALAESIASTAAGPLEHLVAHEALELVQQVLDTLKEDKREVFVMAELEQLSAPEIGEVLSIPLNTVYSRLRAARQEFEREIQRLGALP